MAETKALSRFYDRLLAPSGDTPKEGKGVQRHQDRLLRETIGSAYKQVRFWRELMDREKITPDDISRVENLPRFPLSSKEDLLSRPLRDRLAMDPRKCVRMATSGTTGEPMEVYYSRGYVLSTGMMLRAQHQKMLGLGRMYKWLQISYAAPDDPSKSVTASSDASSKNALNNDEDPRARRKSTLGLGTSIVGPLVDRFLRTVYFDREIEEVIQKILQFKADLISGNAYYLRLLASYVEKHGSLLRPSALLSTGGPFDEPTRRFLESKIACPAFQMYGSSEIGPVAIECRKKNGMHIFSDKVIVEVLGIDGSPCPPGDYGEIIVTGLTNNAMPLIRYRMLDIGSLSPERKCGCGSSLPKLQSVEGREVDHIVTPNGTWVSPRKIISLMHQNDRIARCQVVQNSFQSITLKVFLPKGAAYDGLTINGFSESLRKIIGPTLDLNVSVEDDAQIGAKLRPVIRTFQISKNYQMATYVA